MHTIRVWDLPLRLFHWCLFASVLGMVLTATFGWMDWHLRLGFWVLSLLLFRLIWGFFGSRWALFRSFVPGARTLLTYLRGEGTDAMEVGHNPLGALSVLAMLLALGLQVLSGMAADDEISTSGPLASHVGTYWVTLATYYHTKLGKYLVFVLVALHIGAILRYRLRGRDLVTPMLQGDKKMPFAAAASRDDMGLRIWGAVCFISSVATVFVLVRALG